MKAAPWVLKLPWELIEEIAEQQNVPANLLGAIVQAESGNNRFAMRFEPKYKWTFRTKELAQDLGITEQTEMALQMFSWGLCQVMGSTARELGLRGPIFQLLEEKTNLEYASKLIKRLAGRFKSGDDIIAAYNAGFPVKTISGKYKNQSYVDRVNDNLEAIKGVIQHGESH